MSIGRDQEATGNDAIQVRILTHMLSFHLSHLPFQPHSVCDPEKPRLMSHLPLLSENPLATPYYFEVPDLQYRQRTWRVSDFQAGPDQPMDPPPGEDYDFAREMWRYLIPSIALYYNLFSSCHHFAA